ncbi:hypothetical protein [Polynucleobacter antarcticus]|uniref:hypothetical protein n=1 Tax=Polynucleobacter antarcticus TaxID=1743162 RepID=UPI0020C6CD44|nr:hypothetical protein [Polynucleobacter antarcticus]
MIKIKQPSYRFQCFQYFLILTLGLLFAHTGQGQTFSPYTPEQLKQLNSQPLSPMESPLGPVDPNTIPGNPQQPSPLDARYVQKPAGEAQAEGQEMESAAPFEPMPATFKF